jgi:hypothetical protein
VDLDVIKGNHDLKTLMESANVPQITANSLGQWRGQLLRAFQDAGGEPKAGLAVLPDAARQAGLLLLSTLQTYGIFVVPVGTVESWLKVLGASGQKGAWLANVFVAMGSDPTAAEYARPAHDDVWTFVRAIGAWTGDPRRAGIPQ